MSYDNMPDPYQKMPDPYLVPTHNYSSWLQRVGAYLIDGSFTLIAMIPSYVGIALIFIGSTDTTGYDASGNETIDDWTINTLGGVGIAIAVVGMLAAIAFAFWNIVIRQGRKGSTLGKQLLGMRLIREDSGAPIGVGMCFLRQLLHMVDGAVCYLGYLWPLWDNKRQTFADKIVATVVINQR